MAITQSTSSVPNNNKNNNNNNNNNNTRLMQVAHDLCWRFFVVPLCGRNSIGEHVTGSAKRRRERRLRQWLRHRADDRRYGPWPRVNTTPPYGDRAWPGPGGGARDELHGHAPDNAPPRAASALYFSLDDDVGVLAARTDRLYEVRPQERVLRRTVEQNVGVFTYPASRCA